jgi:hypothetical protein
MWPMTQFRRLPRSAQAMAVLRATVFTVCFTIGVWLVLWLLLVRPTVNLIAAVPQNSPVLPHSLSALLPPNVDTEVAHWRELRFDSLDAISSKIDEYSGQPIVIYLTAPFACAPMDRLTNQAIGRDTPDGSKQLIGVEAIERFWKMCRDYHRDTKVLLIIDPGRIGPDPAIGPSDESSVDWLITLRREGTPPVDSRQRREWDKKWRNFGIFCACSPKQWSWPIEGQARTVFDKVLNQSLAKPRKLKKTRELVIYWVHQIVRQYFPGAAQNPMYLGDPELDFLVRPEKPRSAAVVEGGEDLAENRGAGVWKDLLDEYGQRDQYEKWQPYRYAPLAWRNYQDRLLRAERLYRAYRLEEAATALSSASDIANQLADRKTDSFGSLALGIRYAPYSADYGKRAGALISALAPTESPPPAASTSEVGKGAAPSDKKPEVSPAAARQVAGDIRESDDAFLRRIRLPLPVNQDLWKNHVEWQLIEWIVAYKQLPPFRKAEIFTDDRKELFTKAAQMRITAEQLAAAALDPKTALRLAVESGDHHRRVAQDLLFIDQPDIPQRAKTALDLAEQQYQWAGTFVHAQDLVGQMQSELPFLAEWHLRYSARQRSPSSATDLDPIKEIADLTHELDEELRSERRSPEGDRYFNSILDRYRKLKDRHAKLLGAYRDDLASAERTTEWRLLDDVLLVPSVDAARRTKLVERVREFPRVAKNAEGAAGTAPDEANQPPGKGMEEIGRAAFTHSLGRWFFEQGVSALDGKQQARAAPDFEPAWIYDEQIDTADDKSYRPIADRVNRVAAAIQKIDRPSAAKLEDRLEGLMEWMAGRTIDDADPKRARKFHAGGDLDQKIKPLEQNQWLSRFTSDCRKPLAINAVPITIDVQAHQGIPAGVGCLLVDVIEPQDRGKIELFHKNQTIERGCEAVIDSATPEAVELYVDRGPSHVADTARLGRGPAVSTVVGLKPLLFYRGQTFDGTTGQLVLDPVTSQFIVGIESDREQIALDQHVKVGELPEDQFTKRPGAVTGFAYPGCFHPSMVTILYQATEKKNAEVDVECDGAPVDKPHLSLETGKKQTLAHIKIVFDYDKPRDPKAPLADERYLRQKTLVVSVWPTGKRAKGKPLVKQAIELSEVNPAKFNTITIGTSTRQGGGANRVINVSVRRHENDPVVRPVGVLVESLDNPELAGRFQWNSSGRSIKPPHLDSKQRIGLSRGDSCMFQFELSNVEPHEKKYKFKVTFAGEFTMEKEIAVAGSGASPPPAQPAANAAPAQ